MVEDQKKSMKMTIRRQKTSQATKLGLAFLGQNYMQAYVMYESMGNQYLQMAREHPSALSAAMKCFIFGAENANAIQAMFQEETHQTKVQMKTKFKEMLQLAEVCQQKISADPMKFDHKKVFLSKFNERERIIVEGSAAKIKGKNVDLWQPHTGIVK